MKEPKYITEGYEKDGVAVSPLADDEKFEWYAFPSRPTRERTSDKQSRRFTHCDRLVSQGRSSQPCGRDAVCAVTSGGRRVLVCGPHLNGELRAAANDRKRHALDVERKENEAAAETRLAAAGAVLGMGASLDYMYGAGRYSTTHAVVSIADLERLAAEKVARDA